MAELIYIPTNSICCKKWDCLGRKGTRRREEEERRGWQEVNVI
jgi:hypothetical protein